jgi:AcrR family transcriptional regulator
VLAVPEEELGPLPAGRHGLSREQVAHSQRERLIAGLAAAVGEHGYNEVTITHITEAASVSRRAFYEHFESKEDCFLAAFEIVAGHIHQLMAGAIESAPDWPHGVVAGFRAILDFLVSEPELARLSLVDSMAAGPAVAERFRAGVQSFIPLLEPGRAERASARPLPDSTEDSLIGATVSLLSRSIATGGTERLLDLLPDISEFILTPYLGPEEARRLALEASS